MKKKFYSCDIRIVHALSFDLSNYKYNTSIQDYYLHGEGISFSFYIIDNISEKIYSGYITNEFLSDINEIEYNENKEFVDFLIANPSAFHLLNDGITIFARNENKFIAFTEYESIIENNNNNKIMSDTTYLNLFFAN